MSIQLKLDAQAMAALFPEGSEVRLELQQAVINETVRKLVDRELTKTRAQIAEQCRVVVSEALTAEGLTSRLWQGVRLSDSYVRELKEHAVAALREASHKVVAEAVNPVVADIERRIRREVDSGLEVRLNLLAKEALRGALK